MTNIVRLLVRETSGAHYVDQGLMFRHKADEHRLAWNEIGYCTVIVKDQSVKLDLKIVPRSSPPSLFLSPSLWRRW